MEKQREEHSREGKEQLEHTFTIKGKPLKISAEKGAKLSDILRELVKAHPSINLNDFGIVVNDRTVKEEEGELKEDPVLDEATVVTLWPKVVGGKLLLT